MSVTGDVQGPERCTWNSTLTFERWRVSQMPLLHIRDNPKPTTPHYLHITRNPQEGRLNHASQSTSSTCLSPLPSSVWWLGFGLTPFMSASWLELGLQWGELNPAFLREENTSRNPPADVLSHGSELGHALMLKPTTWPEWNLHDNWRVRPLPTFPKAHGPAEKSGFWNKIEVPLEKKRVVKGCRKITSSMCYSH